MKAKKYKQGLVTSLTALSTAMLCQTATTYASDIEIYKAPTNGGATLMFLLDLSGSMAGSSPIQTDFFDNKNCTSENLTVSTAIDGSSTSHSFSGQFCWISETQLTNRSKRTSTVKEWEIERWSGNRWRFDSTEFISSTANSTTNLTGNMTASDSYSTLSTALQSKIVSSCISSNINGPVEYRDRENITQEGTWNEYSSGRNYYRKREITKVVEDILATETGIKYNCPDRVTMLKRSLFDLIAGNSSVGGLNHTLDPLPETASIGFTTFYNSTPEVKLAPLVLGGSGNKRTLLNEVAGWRGVGYTPIVSAYALGAGALMKHVSNSEAACAGYGVYYLTDGDPNRDSYGAAVTNNSNYINYYLKSGSRLTYSSGSGNCTDSWDCVALGASGIVTKTSNTEGVEVKTAVVGFGSDFSFGSAIYNPTTTYKYTGNQTPNDNKDLRNLFSGNALKAAQAAVIGKGGWYSASNTSDIVSSVTNFVDSIKIPIPAITTGTSAIPQDVLNTSVIRKRPLNPTFSNSLIPR